MQVLRLGRRRCAGSGLRANALIRCVVLCDIQVGDQPVLTFIPYFGDEVDAKMLTTVYMMK